MEKENTLAAFQMLHYEILKLHFDQPHADFNANGCSLAYFANSRQSYSDGAWHGSIALGFRLAKDGDEVNNTYFEGVIAGDFAEPCDSEENSAPVFQQKLRRNGALALIPILRAASASLSAIMGHPDKFTLPMIDVRELAWKEE